MRMGNTVIMRNAGFQFRRTVNDGSGRDLSAISTRTSSRSCGSISLVVAKLAEPNQAEISAQIEVARNGFFNDADLPLIEVEISGPHGAGQYL